MKRVIGLLVFTALLAVPSLALAQDKLGVYVAPKLGFGGFMADVGYETGEPGRNITELEINGGDHVFGGALAVGYDFKKRSNLPMRAELEYAMFSDAEVCDNFSRIGGDYEKWKYTTGIQTLFVNIYYDFHNASALTPYVGLGMGLSFVDVSAKTTHHIGINVYSASMGEDSTTNFAWNLGVGLAYAFTDNFSLDFNYRFAGLGKGESKRADIGGNEYIQAKAEDIFMHQAMLGLRFTF